MFKLLIFAIFVLTTSSLNIEDDLVAVDDENDNVRNQYLYLWDLPKDVDIWDENTKNAAPQPVMSKAKVKRLCTNYDVLIDDQIIDCKDLKLIQKLQKMDDSHQLSKRQAEPEVSLDEGSGHGEEHSVAEEHSAVEVHQSVDEHPAIKEHEEAVKEHQFVKEYAKDPVGDHPALEHPSAVEKESQETTSVSTDSEHVATEHVEDLYQHQSGNVVDLHAVDAEIGDTSKNVQKNAEIKMSVEETPTEGSTEAHPIGHDVQHLAEEKPTESSLVSETMPSVETSPEELGDEKHVEQKLGEVKPSTVVKDFEVKLVSEEPVSGNQTSEPSGSEKLAEPTPADEKVVKIESIPETKSEASLASSSQPEHTVPPITEAKPAGSIDVQKPVVEEKTIEASEPPAVEKIKPVVGTSATPDALSSPSEAATPQLGTATKDKSKETAKEKDSEKKSLDKKGRKATNMQKEPEDGIATASMGEAKEAVSQKDTKILIGLFGAVIGCGAAAFAYNYIRKRKRANARRVTTNGINNPEDGREMKPLMKGEGSIQKVEYRDEKLDKTEEVR